MRHAGASHDLLQNLRTIEAVKLRGRWRCDQSLVRYGKATRAMATARMIDNQVLEYGIQVQQMLALIFRGLKKVPAPPSILNVSMG